MTAVEQLLDELETLFSELHNGSLITKKEALIKIEDVKLIFKQQIKDAYNQGFRDGLEDYDYLEVSVKDVSEFSNAEDYYNQTFKNES